MPYITLTILRPPVGSAQRGPFTLRFNGPKATVRETTAEFVGGGGDLRAVGVDSRRRLVPFDPIWWAAFIPMPDQDVPAQIDVEFSLESY